MQAADLAAWAGCDVANTVTRKTTILVVGLQDPAVLASKSRSTKPIRAERLIVQGFSIRILDERAFYALVSLKKNIWSSMAIRVNLPPPRGKSPRGAVTLQAARVDDIACGG